MSSEKMAARIPTEQRDTHINDLCNAIREGSNLQVFCSEIDRPNRTTMLDWMEQEPDYADKYARAREARADARSDRIDDIAKQTLSGTYDPQAARVAIDAEKWQAGRENWKRYGDKLTLDGDLTVKIPDEQLNARVSDLLRKAGIAVASAGDGEAEKPA
jgi:hypothetical protein